MKTGFSFFLNITSRLARLLSYYFVTSLGLMRASTTVFSDGGRLGPSFGALSLAIGLKTRATIAGARYKSSKIRKQKFRRKVSEKDIHYYLWIIAKHDL